MVNNIKHTGLYKSCCTKNVAFDVEIVECTIRKLVNFYQTLGQPTLHLYVMREVHSGHIISTTDVQETSSYSIVKKMSGLTECQLSPAFVFMSDASYRQN